MIANEWYSMQDTEDNTFCMQKNDLQPNWVSLNEVEGGVLDPKALLHYIKLLSPQ